MASLGPDLSRIRSSTGFLLSAAGLGFLLANLVVAALDQLLGPEAGESSGSLRFSQD